MSDDNENFEEVFDEIVGALESGPHAGSTRVHLAGGSVLTMRGLNAHALFRHLAEQGYAEMIDKSGRVCIIMAGGVNAIIGAGDGEDLEDDE